MPAKEIKLISMTMRNIKGVKDFTFVLDGKNATIYGDNGAGKTTCFDGFSWGIFGKDSANRSNFSLKTTDENGDEYHGLEHEVILELLVDGVKRTIKKQLTEKWTKKHGEAEKLFTGHGTKYWIDEVPTADKEFTKRMGEIIDEAAFKLLTNPFYFNDMLSWQKRRDVLVKMAGDISDAAVINSAVTIDDKSMLDLIPLLKGRKVDDLKGIISERLKETNAEIAKVPIRIDEQNRVIEGIPNIDFAAIEAEIREHGDTISNLDMMLSQGNQQASALRILQQQAGKIETAMRQRRQELDDAAKVGVDKVKSDHTKLYTEAIRADSDIQIMGGKINNLKDLIKSNEETLTDLRNQWNAEAEKEFIEPDSNSFTCVTCGQALPEGTRSQKTKDMRDRFERNKELAMDALSQKALPLRAKTDTAKEDLVNIENSLEAKKIQHAELQERLAELAKAIEDEQKQVGPVDYDQDAKYTQLKAELQQLQDKINQPSEDTTSDLIAQKRALEVKVNELNKTLNNKDTAKRAKERIEDLLVEERKLSATATELERQKYLLEKFITTKVSLIDDRINGRFKFVKFKLFDKQINGGINECCEALVNTNGSWVPFQDANHAGKVNAGLDVINALAEHFGCTAPIFIDFRESVTEIIPTKSQVINLFKNEADKKLRVEVWS